MFFLHHKMSKRYTNFRSVNLRNDRYYDADEALDLNMGQDEYEEEYEKEYEEYEKEYKREFEKEFEKKEYEDSEEEEYEDSEEDEDEYENGESIAYIDPRIETRVLVEYIANYDKKKEFLLKIFKIFKRLIKKSKYYTYTLSSSMIKQYINEIDDDEFDKKYLFYIAVNIRKLLRTKYKKVKEIRDFIEYVNSNNEYRFYYFDFLNLDDIGVRARLGLIDLTPENFMKTLLPGETNIYEKVINNIRKARAHRFKIASRKFTFTKKQIANAIMSSGIPLTERVYHTRAIPPRVRAAPEMSIFFDELNPPPYLELTYTSIPGFVWYTPLNKFYYNAIYYYLMNKGYFRDNKRKKSLKRRREEDELLYLLGNVSFANNDLDSDEDESDMDMGRPVASSSKRSRFINL